MRQQPDGIQNKQQITKICKQTSKCNQSEQCLSTITATMYPKKEETESCRWQKIIEKKTSKGFAHKMIQTICVIYANELDVFVVVAALFLSHIPSGFIFVDKVLWPKVMGQKLFRI